MEYYTRLDQEDFSKKLEREGIDISQIEYFTPEIADKIGLILRYGILNDQWGPDVHKSAFGLTGHPSKMEFEPILDESKKAIGLKVKLYDTYDADKLLRSPSIAINETSFYVDSLTKDGELIPCIRAEEKDGCFHHFDVEKNKMVPQPNNFVGVNALGQIVYAAEIYRGTITESTRYYDLNGERLNKHGYCEHIPSIEYTSHHYDVKDWLAQVSYKEDNNVMDYKKTDSYRLAQEILSKPDWAIQKGIIISREQDLNKQK